MRRPSRSENGAPAAPSASIPATEAWKAGALSRRLMLSSSASGYGDVRSNSLLGLGSDLPGPPRPIPSQILVADEVTDAATGRHHPRRKLPQQDGTTNGDSGNADLARRRRGCVQHIRGKNCRNDHDQVQWWERKKPGSSRTLIEGTEVPGVSRRCVVMVLGYGYSLALRHSHGARIERTPVSARVQAADRRPPYRQSFQQTFLLGLRGLRSNPSTASQCMDTRSFGRER